jgi:hypothetical protein
MTQSFDGRSRAIGTSTRGIHALIAVIACVAIFIAAVIAVMSSPATAQFKKTQSAKKGDAIGKELQTKRDAGDCKVTAAGYFSLFGTPETFIEVACAGGSPIQTVAPKGQEQAVLSVALAAMSTGRPVAFAAVDDNGPVGMLILLSPK